MHCITFLKSKKWWVMKHIKVWVFRTVLISYLCRAFVIHEMLMLMSDRLLLSARQHGVTQQFSSSPASRCVASNSLVTNGPGAYTSAWICWAKRRSTSQVERSRQSQVSSRYSEECRFKTDELLTYGIFDVIFLDHNRPWVIKITESEAGLGAGGLL